VTGVLADRVAVITGGASGLGAAIARRFAAEGAHVVVADIDGAAAVTLAAEITDGGGTATAHTCDVTDAGQVAALMEMAAGLDEPLKALVLSAAVERRAALTECTDEDWALTLDTNLKGPFLCLKEGLPAMVAAGGGAVVALGSTLGQIVAAKYPAYCASKFALTNLCKQVAIEHAADGVRVNVLAPSACDTGLFMRMSDSVDDPEGLRSMVASNIPMRRLGRAEEVAEAAVFLASDASSYVSGAVVPLDGGLAARRSS
jgi:NAD(P)-dependent dehydrogenase (short-subunit alcohol dehydrogenase family)